MRTWGKVQKFNSVRNPHHCAPWPPGWSSRGGKACVAGAVTDAAPPRRAPVGLILPDIVLLTHRDRASPTAAPIVSYGLGRHVKAARWARPAAAAARRSGRP